MRTRLIIAMLLAYALLACSLVTRPDEPAEQPATPPAPLPSTSSPPTVAPPAPPPSTGSPPATAPPALPLSTGSPLTAGSGAIPYFGEQSIEERIANADVVVRARLATTTSEVVTTTTEEWSDYYYVGLKFHLTVSEYLKGRGASSITALTIQGGYYDTRREAEDAKPGIADNRVSTWDDREAIIFINSDHPYDAFRTAVQGANDYFLTIGGLYRDRYSLQDRHSKLWLPSAETSETGDDQEFLLAVPESGKDTPTIAIRELKRRIAAVDAEMNAGDGSEAYRNCVSYKYRVERVEQHAQSEGRKLWVRAGLDTHSVVSGSSAGTVIFESELLGIYPDTKMRTTLEGRDAGLFKTVDGPADPWDWNRDGVLTDGIDSIRYTQTLRPMRPIPAGEYKFNVKDLEPNLIPCNAFLINEWTVTAVAPDGVLHELFFDPVTIASAVAADTANGVLKPASFTDAIGATTTIERIAWEAGTVSIELSPHTGVAGHAVDFIALDGSVSLSLDVADATVDTANNTQSWPVASQPWRSGDKLMLRIREAPDCSMGAVTDTSANPGLARDCEILLVVMDTLRGTATLNWNTTTTITAWDGVTVSGTPSLVTRLELANEGLDGSIPEFLGRLLGLAHLDLSRNSLTGAIPFELGRLSNLEALRLSGNSLTGCIPVALMSVATNDLSSLNLRYCRPPAPENLSIGTSTATSIPLSWDAVSGAVGYRVEYRSSTSSHWTVDTDTALTTSHVIDDLTCGTDFRFRASAFGIGTVYAPGWSEPSEPVQGTTTECRAGRTRSAVEHRRDRGYATARATELKAFADFRPRT